MTPKTDKYLTAFGKRVAELRRQVGLTQEQLAAKTTLTVRTVASIEQGRRWAKLGTLHKLSRGLAVATSDLFTGLK